MFICPQCGEEVVGKLDDHYRFYPECAQKAAKTRAVTTVGNLDARRLADPQTVYDASLLLAATREIAVLKEADYRNQAATPRTIQEFLQWLGGMLPKAMPRVPRQTINRQ